MLLEASPFLHSLDTSTSYLSLLHPKFLHQSSLVLEIKGWLFVQTIPHHSLLGNHQPRGCSPMSEFPSMVIFKGLLLVVHIPGEWPDLYSLREELATSSTQFSDYPIRCPCSGARFCCQETQPPAAQGSKGICGFSILWPFYLRKQGKRQTHTLDGFLLKFSLYFLFYLCIFTDVFLLSFLRFLSNLLFSPYCLCTLAKHFKQYENYNVVTFCFQVSD